MKAIIMAGGEGTRLRPLTCSMPKPMARIMNKPVMEHIINLLKKHGITEIGVTLMYMPKIITDYFGDGSDFGVNITYFTEETPLGTAGSVKNAGNFLNDDFLVISGDALCDINLTEVIEFHKQKKSEATLVLKSMEIPIEYGVVVINQENKIVRFLEKPAWSQVFSDTVNTGIYVLNPDVLNMADSLPADFSKDIFPGMLSENRPMYGFVTEGYWCDIGDINAYRHCHYDILDKKLSFETGILENPAGIYIDKSAVVEEGAKINAPVYIGAGTRIKSGAVIDSYTVIGDNVTVCKEATIKRSVVYDGSIIEKGAQVRGAVLCDKTIIRESANVFEQAVIGSGSIVSEKATVKPSVKIWPSKVVEGAKVQSENLVWGYSNNKVLFSERGISGEVNSDITPELAGKIGAALGSMNKKSKMGISCDGTAASVMLKNSIQSGLLSAGAGVYDFGEQPIPVTRAGIASYGLDGGVHVSSDRPEECSIDILNSHGANIPRKTEKKLQNILLSEDFKRAEAESVGEITGLYEYKLYYLREIINPIKKRDKKLKMLFAVSSKWGGKLLSDAAKELDCHVTIIRENINFGDEEALKRFSEQVTKDDYNIGAVFDHACEEMIIFDERGRMLSPDKYRVLAALITMKKYEKAHIVTTVSAPSVIEELAYRYDATVERTRESLLELMEGLCRKEGREDLKEQFVLYFDAVGAIIKIVDFMSENESTLSLIVDEIPRFFVVRKEVECRFGDKGKVVRQIIEDAEGKEVKTIDGVDITEKNGRVVIIPDNTKPVCKIMSEACEEEYADALAEIYLDKIKNGNNDTECR